MRRIGRPERLLRVGRDDLGIRTLSRAVGFHLIQGFRHAPGKRFLVPPDIGFVSVL
jgi:hypothetical protein